jgi:hypothetical protein
MSDNPFEPPRETPQAVGVLSGRREDLRSVALYQKGILVCILIQLIAIASQFFVPAQVQQIFFLGMFVASLAGTVFVVLLAIKVYGAILGIFLGLITLAPCIGLIVLLLVNGKATNTLRQNGIKVGLMGANLSSI